MFLREVHVRRRTAVRIIESGFWTGAGTVHHTLRWRHRRDTGRGGGGRSDLRVRHEVHLAAVPTPQLAHLLSSLAHQHLVFGDAHFLAVHYTRSFWSWSIPIRNNCSYTSNYKENYFDLPVVWVFFHMQLGQSRLFLVIWLFLGVGHALPSRTQNFWYVGVVHVRTRLQNLPSFVFCPHHERVHGTFNVWLTFVISFWLLSDYFGLFRVFIHFKAFLAPHCNREDTLLNHNLLNLEYLMRYYWLVK